MKRETVPCLIMADPRTLEIASAILQKVTHDVSGTEKVTAFKRTVFKTHLYSDIVTWVHQSDARREQLYRFYLDEWSALPTQKKAQTIPIRWDIAAHAALAEIANEFPLKQRKNGNKSLTFCVIMAFAAKHRYGIPIRTRQSTNRTL